MKFIPGSVHFFTDKPKLKISIAIIVTFQVISPAVNYYVIRRRIFKTPFKMVFHSIFVVPRIFLTETVLLDEIHLVKVRGTYPPKTFQQIASTRTVQLSVAATSVRFNGSSQLSVKTRVNAD